MKGADADTSDGKEEWMTPLNHYLPAYHFCEEHARDIAADPLTVIQAAANYRPEADPAFRHLIGLREVPMRLGHLLGRQQSASPPPFGLHRFVPLDSQDDNTLLYGLVGRFWRPDFGLVTMVDSQAYLDFAAPGVAKLALGFSASRQPNGTTRLTTQTRVFCPDLACRLKFAPYWYLIRPVSGLIRRRILGAIKAESERGL